MLLLLLLDSKPCGALRAGATGKSIHSTVFPRQHCARSRPILALNSDIGILTLVDLASDINLVSLVDEWFTNQPYESAFTVTAFKATCSDLLAQARERMTDAAARPTGEEVVGDAVSDALESEDTSSEIMWQRTLAFLLYGGLYQGCAQYFIFNECFPLWFGPGEDILTVVEKVIFDQFVITPLLCLPVIYLLKAIVFAYPVSEGFRRYFVDAQNDLLIKYWALWTPVQCLTFGVVPTQWRIPFIAFVSFFWLIVLSSITARDDAARAIAGTPQGHVGDSDER